MKKIPIRATILFKIKRYLTNFYFIQGNKYIDKSLKIKEQT